MDEAEARAILAAELAKLRSTTYAALVETLLGKPALSERIGASGACYQVETQVFWDNPPGGDVRVSAAIDDGGWRAFAPLTDSFILAPDGRFVGD